MSVFRWGFVLFLLLFFAIGLFWFCGRSMDFTDLRVGETRLHVEVVDTVQARTRGLSGREGIGSDGMLFVFSDVRPRTFWMNEMKFPIDILFIQDGIVREIALNLMPPLLGEQPVSYHSIYPADLVLEVPAGDAARYGWDAGTIVSF